MLHTQDDNSPTGFAAERAAVVVVDFKSSITRVLAADLTTVSGTLQKGVPSGQIHIIGFVRNLELVHPQRYQNHPLSIRQPSSPASRADHARETDAENQGHSS
jgi:hypothetical protein